MSERTEVIRRVRRGWPALALAAVAGLVLASSGCIKPWKVYRQATPNPFLAGADFRVEKMGFQGLMVGNVSEAHHLTKKDAGQRASWEEDKLAMDQAYRAEIVGHAQSHGIRFHAGAKYAVHTSVTHIEPGFYVGVAAAPTEVSMNVTIKDAQGNVLDVIGISVQVEASLYKPSVGQRVREAAGYLGRIVARYLNERTHPQ
jgi:hypothetical protein